MKVSADGLGESGPGEQVAAELSRNGKTVGAASAKSGEDGVFHVFLPALEAGRDLTLTVVSGGESVSFRDVLIGEVWIAGGLRLGRYGAAVIRLPGGVL